MIVTQRNLKILRQIVQDLAQRKIKNSREFLNLERKLSKKYKTKFLSNVEIYNFYKKLRLKRLVPKNNFLEKLKKRPVRSLSGVAVVSVLTKSWPCPGRCIYCPAEKGLPKSYLSGEPAVERAKLLKFDPYLQVKKRIETLEKIGHPADKIELIVIGGTWSYLPQKYQTWFITRCFQAANADKRRYQTLSEAQQINEKAKHRIIGITLETRPDYINPQEILRMRKLGCTRVELGIQAIDDKILKTNQRGHGVKEIIEATKLLKDTGLKVCYHLMPGLLGSNPKKDFQMFQEIFSNPDFQPDLIKIYPCVVTKGSKIYKLWRQKKYKPYSNKQLIDLLVKIKSIIPPYVRIIRIVRDIPSSKIEAGCKISNLREQIQKELKKRRLKCHCIRCREVKNLKLKMKNLKLNRIEYKASDGKEVFLSFEDIKNDKLVAFLRLRLPKNYSTIRANRRNSQNDIIYRYFPELKDAAIIREIHTYGELVPIGQRNEAIQHKNLGKKLIKEAEKIAKKFGYKKIAVISGIGARQYYRKLGYKLKKTYMVKKL